MVQVDVCQHPFAATVRNITVGRKDRTMPGRLTIAFILTFFVGMAGWQWVRNFGNSLGEGPQLKPSLELAAEDGSTNWLLRYNQQRLGDAQTQVTKTSQGVYVLKQNVLLDGDLETFMGPIGVFAKLSGIKLNEFRATLYSEMELTYLGTMRKMHMTFVARPRPTIVLPGSKEEQQQQQKSKALNRAEKDDLNSLLRLVITAEVLTSEQMNFKGSFTLAGMRFPIEDVKVRYRSKDSFLSSISPTDCMAGIRLGQRWHTPMIDPTQMMVAALATSKAKELGSTAFNLDDQVKTKIAEVRVLDELKELEWDGRKVACYLVQSIERTSKLQIWVNAENYRVLKQSFESDKHLMELIREPKKEQ